MQHLIWIYTNCSGIYIHVFGHMQTEKTQISLHICTVWSEPSLSANKTHVFAWCSPYILLIQSIAWTVEMCTQNFIKISHVVGDLQQFPHLVERCSAVVKCRTRDREVPGSIPTNSKWCFLEQETLSTLLSTGFYPGKKRATWKISTKLLNVLPSINKVDYYYYYYLHFFA